MRVAGGEAGIRDPARAGSRRRVSEPEPLGPAGLTAPRVNNTESPQPEPLRCSRSHRFWDLQSRSLRESPRREHALGAHARDGVCPVAWRGAGVRDVGTRAQAAAAGPRLSPHPTPLPSVPGLGPCRVNAADCTHRSWQREQIWVGPTGKVAAARVSSVRT